MSEVVRNYLATLPSAQQLQLGKGMSDLEQLIRVVEDIITGLNTNLISMKLTLGELKLEYVKITTGKQWCHQAMFPKYAGEKNRCPVCSGDITRPLEDHDEYCTSCRGGCGPEECNYGTGPCCDECKQSPYYEE